ncbi:unnamed protein product [Effrenium voratum]|nr:unnamed protein product [Effrenium voratum]
MVDQVVLSAFQRFDQDGNGSISREELGSVLKSLQPDGQWDSNAVDYLLAGADASGDGELQIDEFLQWIFAEDPKALGLGLGRVADFTYVISGCSRDELNGEYTQQAQFYSHRPIFYCGAKKMYLFYWEKRQQWQIYKRIASKACARLKSTRAPHLPGRDVGWQVWKQKEHSLKKGYITEMEMSCGSPPSPPPEEQIARAAKAIYVRKYGGFTKQEELFGGRPVYYNEMYKKWMIYVEPLQEWKLTYEKDESPGDERSGKTRGYSPELSTWSSGGGVVMDVFAYDPNQSLNKAVPEGWFDPDFPHTVESLGERFEGTECEWVRALALSPSPMLLEDPEPADACQGQLGDAWLIAAIAAVAEFPNYLKDKIFKTQQVTSDGKYEIQLFDWKESKEWKVIQVDDYLPCKPRVSSEPTQAAMFADLSSDGKLYVPLLEKAFAKMFGSYQRLHQGDTTMAFASLTGCTKVRNYSSWVEKPESEQTLTKGSARWVVTLRDGLTVRSKKDPKSTKLGQLARGATFQELERDCYRIMFKKLSGEGPASGWISYYSEGKQAASRSTEVRWSFRAGEPGQSLGSGELMTDMWKTLLEADAANHLIAVDFEFKAASPDGRPVYGTRPDGLMPRHVYSVLSAREVAGDVWEAPKRMVCLRNPWGRCEWKGPWCDQGDEWEDKEVAEACRGEGDKWDGLFFMAWEDFQWCASTLTVVPVEMASKRGDHQADEEE